MDLSSGGAVPLVPGPGIDMVVVARATGWSRGLLPVYRTDGDDSYVLFFTHPSLGPYHLRFRRGELAEVIGQPSQGRPITCHPGDAHRRMEFECPLYWDNLVPTGDEKVRQCRQCDRPVYYCDTESEVSARASRRECVAFRTPLQVRMGMVRA